MLDKELAIKILKGGELLNRSKALHFPFKLYHNEDGEQVITTVTRELYNEAEKVAR